ncbi:hypothetical protein [Pollutibacter soli]|uniref:hypothetical protein n=1 Tax=Pollutibacter soli TaxID=3034157 RepID=UPI003013E5A1
MKNTVISNKTAAYNGALIAVAGVFAYSFAVMLYTIIRTSVSICSIMPSPERSKILWASGFSVAYSVGVFSFLMAMVSSMAGAVAGVILRRVLLWLNPDVHLSKSILISSIVSLVLLLLLYLVLYILLKERITLQYAGTFLFWYVFPAVIFFIAVLIGGAVFSNSLMKEKTNKTPKD